MLFINKFQIVFTGKLRWNVLLLKNTLHVGNGKPASLEAASHHPIVDSFSITARP